MTKRYTKLFLLLVAISFLASILLSGCQKKGGENNFGKGANTTAETDRVKIVKDIEYFSGEKINPDKHILDIYIPKGKETFPVLFTIHGGGWTSGDKVDAAGVGMTFAEKGIGVVVISYRLYPEARYPAVMNDVGAAFSWVHRNIDKYGGDPTKIFIFGYSAGGHMGSLLATNTTFLSKYNLSKKNIRGVIALSGAFQIYAGLFPEIFDQNQQTFNESSPQNFIDEKTPPFLILYADNDLKGLASQAQTMTDKLKAKGVFVRSKMVDQRDHFTIAMGILNPGDPAKMEILAFIDKLD